MIRMSGDIVKIYLEYYFLISNAFFAFTLVEFNIYEPICPLKQEAGIYHIITVCSPVYLIDGKKVINISTTIPAKDAMS